MQQKDIYVPPQIKKGLMGRDGIGEYNPYAPSPVSNTAPGNSARYWPQPMSNHRPIMNVKNNDIASFDSTHHAKNAIAEAKRKIQQIAAMKKNPNNDIMTTSRAMAMNRRPRGHGMRYSESSEDERGDQIEYRDMDDDGTASYLVSPSTIDTTLSRDDNNNYRGDGHDNNPLSPEESIDKQQQQRLGFITKSISENGTFETNNNNDGLMSFDDTDSFFVKATQPPAICSVAVTSIQLLLFMLQLTMCGVATLDVNPTVGPFPDAFSEWGGKNPYLTLQDQQWWRLITPAFLHVGIAHWMVNMYCQITAGTMFEREWGWSKWLFIYIASEIGCSAFSNLFDPDTIAVGSTGALMGLFAAKLSQVVIFSLFETKSQYGDAIQLHQLSSILCGLTLASLMGALTYIDFSGNLGGLVSGFFAGMYMFSSCIQGCCGRFWCMLFGLVGVLASFVVPLYFFITTIEPDEQLAEVCDYFRSFHPEGYECGCLWN
jgi:membrane associated rhomboid family serine protease